MEAICQCDSVAEYLKNNSGIQNPQFLLAAGKSSNQVVLTDIPTSENSSLANATLTQKMQALLALYDVLKQGNLELDVDRDSL